MTVWYLLDALYYCEREYTKGGCKNIHLQNITQTVGHILPWSNLISFPCGEFGSPDRRKDTNHTCLLSGDERISGTDTSSGTMHGKPHLPSFPAHAPSVRVHR